MATICLRFISPAKTYRFATPTLKQIKCCFFGRRLAVKILKPLDYFLFINTHAKTIGVGRIRTRDLPLKDRVEYIFAFDGPPDPPKKHLAPQLHVAWEYTRFAPYLKKIGSETKNLHCFYARKRQKQGVFRFFTAPQTRNQKSGFVTTRSFAIRNF